MWAGLRGTLRVAKWLGLREALRAGLCVRFFFVRRAYPYRLPDLRGAFQKTPFLILIKLRLKPISDAVVRYYTGQTKADILHSTGKTLDRSFTMFSTIISTAIATA
jgi:hypothetical protein